MSLILYTPLRGRNWLRRLHCAKNGGNSRRSALHCEQAINKEIGKELVPIIIIIIIIRFWKPIIALP